VIPNTSKKNMERNRRAEFIFDFVPTTTPQP
jgi:hypothetical protein